MSWDLPQSMCRLKDFAVRRYSPPGIYTVCMASHADLKESNIKGTKFPQAFQHWESQENTQESLCFVTLVRFKAISDQSVRSEHWTFKPKCLAKNLATTSKQKSDQCCPPTVMQDREYPMNREHIRKGFSVVWRHFFWPSCSHSRMTCDTAPAPYNGILWPCVALFGDINCCQEINVLVLVAGVKGTLGKEFRYLGSLLLLLLLLVMGYNVIYRRRYHFKQTLKGLYGAFPGDMSCCFVPTHTRWLHCEATGLLILS